MKAMACPICGSPVSYQGITTCHCTNRDCWNFVEAWYVNGEVFRRRLWQYEHPEPELVDDGDPDPDTVRKAVLEFFGLNKEECARFKAYCRELQEPRRLDR